MVDIDYIMNLIDWNKDIHEQKKGIEMAEKIENINVFLQPCNKNSNKNVWNNCAIILSKRTDEELSPYLVELFMWLQDMNWPGALRVFDRIQRYSDDVSYNIAYGICIKYAQALSDDIWESNLKKIKRNIDY